MKKNIILLIFACLVCMNVFAYDVDVIITKTREQILCMIISQDGDSITYNNKANLNDEQVYKIAKTDVAKIFIHDSEPVKSVPTVSAKPTPLLEVKSEPKIEKVEEVKSEPKVEKVAPVVEEAPSPQPEIKPDLIITMDAQQIKAKIIEVSKNEIKYKELDNLDGPTFVLNTEEISSIIYSNGKVSVMQHEPKNIKAEEKVISSEVPANSQIPSVAVENISLARVEKVNGVYVFTDCTPEAQYDVIGEVTVTGYESRELQNSLGQYQAVRDALIKTAKSANGMAEGVILTLVMGGTDKAHIIKFRDHSEDCALANVKRYRGIYVFCDCTPLSSYEYVGSLKGSTTFFPQYTYLRDDFLKRCLKKYKNANGMIIQLVNGGKDSAEAIKL